jgi:hypothetical protein
MDTPVVLNGDSPRLDEQAGFLAAFADRVARWTLGDISPKSFRVITLVPLIVVVDVPGISAPPGKCTLQVGYWTDGPYGTAVEGQWGDDHLLDDHTYTSDGLTVTGLDAAPEVFRIIRCRLAPPSTAPPRSQTRLAQGREGSGQQVAVG